MKVNMFLLFRKIVFVPFLSAFMVSISHAESVKGCIAVFNGTTPIIVEVDLPIFTGGLFRTEQFHFSNLPKNMEPNRNGSYCYAIDDDRFAFVHSFYYAVQEIQDYNYIFTQLNLPLPKTLEWTLSLDVNNPSGGNTSISSGYIHYPKPPIDPTTLAHEIGHWIYYNVIGKKTSYRIFTHDKNIQSISRINDQQIEDQQIWIDEGSANILAALDSGDTQQKYDNYDFFQDLNNFVRFPDIVPTLRQTMQQMVNSPRFSIAYPSYVQDIKAEIDENKGPKPWLDLPDPYSVSAAINQPLWKAAMIYGPSKIKLVYLKSLSTLNQDKKYSYIELVMAILKSSTEIDREMTSFLMYEFNIRVF